MLIYHNIKNSLELFPTTPDSRLPTPDSLLPKTIYLTPLKTVLADHNFLVSLQLHGCAAKVVYRGDRDEELRSHFWLGVWCHQQLSTAEIQRIYLA
ncbi:MAG: hypothetical protein F6K55_34965 [Moorea sp. SIO4A3]|nr:hypothetical protein [Moorena sp. SIO4A3]